MPDARKQILQHMFTLLSLVGIIRYFSLRMPGDNNGYRCYCYLLCRMVDQTRLLSETDAMNVLSILRFSLTVSADSVILSWMISLGMFLQDGYDAFLLF